jgi:superfamily I DNA and/or RNA helicase
LVRSNFENRLGFINIENRINVALSRARCGMFVIGNFRMINDYKGENNLWRKIFNLANKKDMIGNKLALQCKMH